MKILYAIQGTGNGHVSRARDIIPLLQKKGEVDILISGVQADIALPYPVKYKLKGLSFIFGKNGGVDLLETYTKNKIRRVIKEIRSLPIEQYDLIINDFEPISAWAAFFKGKQCIALSHQSAVLSKHAPAPRKSDSMGKFLLRKYAPSTAQYGFHFSRFDEHIYTPLIRREIRELKPTDEGHYTVYLPAYDDKKLIKTFTKIKNVQWQVFSKHNKKAITIENVSIQPISNEAFVESLVSSSGIVCGAGFETPAEALFLGKKLMVVPMKNQYEQHCNAAALETMGVPMLKNLKKKHLPAIQKWVKNGAVINVNYPDVTESIIDSIIEKHAALEVLPSSTPLETIPSN